MNQLFALSILIFPEFRYHGIKRMIIELNKHSNTRHLLIILRNDGSKDEMLLETKSYLKHDLIHLAIERAAELQSGFWGLLAAGAEIEKLNADAKSKKGQIPNSDIDIIEVIVGAFTRYLNGDATYTDVFSGVQNMMQAYELPIPEYLSEDMARRSKQLFQQMMGEWNALSYGDKMTLHWTEEDYS